MDNILFVHRPNKTTDPQDNKVLIRSSKIKKQKQNGLPGDVTLEFDFKTNRFNEIIDYEKPKEESMPF